MSVCNCKAPRGCACPSGYECCSQLTPDGEESRLGVCCKKNHCDRKRGICSDKPIIEGYGGNVSVVGYVLGGAIALFVLSQFVAYIIRRYGK